MTDRDHSSKPMPNKQHEPPPSSTEEGEIHHIVDKGLPPGIDVDEAKDPGSQSPGSAPVDNRS